MTVLVFSCWRIPIRFSVKLHAIKACFDVKLTFARSGKTFCHSKQGLQNKDIICLCHVDRVIFLGLTHIKDIFVAFNVFVSRDLFHINFKCGLHVRAHCIDQELHTDWSYRVTFDVDIQETLS